MRWHLDQILSLVGKSKRKSKKVSCWSALCADLKQLGGPTSDSSIPHHTLRATILNRNCDRNGAGNMTIRNARTSITAVARGAAPKSSPHQFVR